MLRSLGETHESRATPFCSIVMKMVVVVVPVALLVESQPMYKAYLIPELCPHPGFLQCTMFRSESMPVPFVGTRPLQVYLPAQSAAHLWSGEK